MDITTRLVIAIKWIGLVLGTIAYIGAFFYDYPYNFLLMPVAFLIWFAPTWTIGWIFKGYKSIIPYPYPMKRDGVDYYDQSTGWLFALLLFPFIFGIVGVVYQSF